MMRFLKDYFHSPDFNSGVELVAVAQIFVAQFLHEIKHIKPVFHSHISLSLAKNLATDKLY